MSKMDADKLASFGKHIRIFRWVGLAVTVLGVAMGIRTVLFLTTAESTTATVVSVRSSTTGTGSDRSTSYYPTVTYSVAEGREITAESSMGSSSFDYREGEQVPILFSPDAPESFRFNSFMGLWGFATLSLAVGVGFVGFTFLTHRLLHKASAATATQTEPAAREKEPNH